MRLHASWKVGVPNFPGGAGTMGLAVVLLVNTYNHIQPACTRACATHRVGWPSTDSMGKSRRRDGGLQPDHGREPALRHPTVHSGRVIHHMGQTIRAPARRPWSLQPLVTLYRSDSRAPR